MPSGGKFKDTHKPVHASKRGSCQTSSSLLSADLFGINDRGRQNANPTSEFGRVKVNDQQQFQKMLNTEKDPQKPICSSRPSRVMRGEEVKENKKSTNTIDKRQQILFDSFEGPATLRSGLKTSLDLLRQVKEREDRAKNSSVSSESEFKVHRIEPRLSTNESYKFGDSQEDRQLYDVVGEIPASMLTQNIQESRSKNISSEFSKTLTSGVNREAFTGNPNVDSHRQTSRQHNFQQRINDQSRRIQGGDKNRYHSQVRDITHKDFRAPASNKIPSASPASTFVLPKEKSTTQRSTMGPKKPQTKYPHKPVHKVYHNFMEDDNDEEIIMQMLEARKRDLYKLR